MKKLLVLFLALGLTFALAACGSEDTSSANSSESSKETKKEDKKKNKDAKMNTNVKVGDMVYNIKSKSTSDKVGPTIAQRTANGKYLIIEAKLRNSGNDKITVDASFFKLKRGKKTYEADSTANISIDNSFLMKQLNPDVEMTGKIIFDVPPKVAEANDLKLEVQAGVFSTQTGTIKLSK
ncbi:DUF4352 domain-containing protein [Bacillus pumilus]|uniref:DUF4352 domain-containing protein n=1 Tax=Bacillus pumilus TaxID=1408 RepID=UPI0011A82F0D|nr:DUF4352 domain-containing protein [Bacillus pumilus]MBU8728235.1 DUF4352 domain-containing protein [Bacillus pumilus]